MKPLTLKIKGIKSFEDEQIVDFTRLSDNNIFVITGVTGAGKSTVLDCVILALYGNKSDGLTLEEYVNLKSDQGFIELKFEAESEGGTRVYTVSRTFYRAKNRSTRSLLCDADSGAVLGEGEQVSKAIGELIGLSCENFTKVIVLEQNRYGEFLKAAKAKRTELVGSLFRLEKYKDLYRRASEKAAAIKRETDAIDEQLRAFEGLTVSSVEQKKRALKELKQRGAAWEKEAESLSQARKELDKQCAAYEQYTMAQTASEAARAALEAAKTALETFEAQSGDALMRQERLQAAVRRENEAAVKRDTIASLSGEESRRKELDSQLAKMRAEYVQAEAKRKTAAREAAREAASKEKLQREKERAAAVVNESGLFAVTARESAAEAAQLTGKLNLLLADRGRAEEVLLSAEKAAREKRERLAQKLRLREKCEAEASTAEERATQAQERCLAASAEAESAKRQNAASTLRAALKKGDVCPVCGARVDDWTDACGSEAADAAALQTAAAEAQQEWTAAREALASVQSNLKHSREDVMRLEQECAEAEQGAEKAKQALCALPLADAAVGRRVSQALAQLEQAAEEEETAERALQQSNADAEGYAAKAEGLRREGEALKNDFNSVSERLNRFLQGEDYAAAAAAAHREAERCRAEREALELREKDFERNRKALEAEKARALGAFESALQNVRQRKCDAPDAAEAARIEKRTREVQAERQAAFQKEGALNSELEQDETNLFIKHEREKERAHLNKRADRLSRLMKMFKGDKFMEFVSQEYIEDFCDVASRYLSRMSGGCYTMGYDCEKADFYVMDFRAGNLKRSVKTLSGGETFLASLSLAIAVSQSIAAKNNAGLKFDFLFLDEGFGTLHRDAIAVVERALRSLAQETLVGIVTHRSELSELIADKLVVDCATADTGSKIHIVN